MAKMPPFRCFLALVFVLNAVLAGVFAGDAEVHDLLRAHGLPGGLLPRAVVNYTLDSSTGMLEARLAEPCYAKYDDGDLAFFDLVVRGNLSFGALRGVEGLAQEELFVWLPVKGILVSEPGSGVILFDIGLAHKRLSRSLFEEPPDCQPRASSDAGEKKGGAVELLGLRKDGHQEQR